MHGNMGCTVYEIITLYKSWYVMDTGYRSTVLWKLPHMVVSLAKDGKNEPQCCQCMKQKALLCIGVHPT